MAQSVRQFVAVCPPGRKRQGESEKQNGKMILKAAERAAAVPGKCRLGEAPCLGMETDS